MPRASFWIVFAVGCAAGSGDATSASVQSGSGAGGAATGGSSMGGGGAGCTPAEEVCDAGMVDENCDGSANEGCACAIGRSMLCGSDEGVCEPGSQSCVSGRWSTCEGGVAPSAEVCANSLDDDCDADIDCADSDCAAQCNTDCGNGKCEGNETSASCPCDCSGCMFNTDCGGNTPLCCIPCGCNGPALQCVIASNCCG